MRASPLFVALLACSACGQKLDHPGNAPACDPAVMNCQSVGNPEIGSGNGNAAGADSGAAAVATFSGQVLAFGDDYFDQGIIFNGKAQVSAAGDSSSRVTGAYDAGSFQLDGVLKTAVNWFLVVPEGTGTLPTLSAVDTRASKSDALVVGLASSLDLDGMFGNSGTDRSVERAQVVLHVVDQQSRSVPGMKGTISATAEITEYRLVSAWVKDDAGTGITDDTGMIFFGNVQAGSALTKATVALSGSATSRIDVDIQVGAVTVVTVIVAGK
jgi:hypothetical protein